MTPFERKFIVQILCTSLFEFPVFGHETVDRFSERCFVQAGNDVAQRMLNEGGSEGPCAGFPNKIQELKSHGWEQVSIDLGCWRMFIPWGDRRHLVSDLMNRFYILRKLFIAALRQCRAVDVAGRVPLQQWVLPGIFFLGDLDIGRPLLRLRLSTTSTWRHLHRNERGSFESSEYGLQKVSHVSCSIKQYLAVSRCTTLFLNVICSFILSV